MKLFLLYTLEKCHIKTPGKATQPCRQSGLHFARQGENNSPVVKNTPVAIAVLVCKNKCPRRVHFRALRGHDD